MKQPSEPALKKSALPPLAITIGDPHGVGPEIVLHAWKKNSLPPNIIVIGDLTALQLCNDSLHFNVPLRKIQRPADIQPGALNVIDLSLLSQSDLQPGTISQAAGAAAIQYVHAATRFALASQISAIVTLPIHKEAARLSDPHFCGHTEFIAQLCGVTNYTMMLASEKLIVTHISTHVSLRQAIDLVRQPRIRDVIQLTHHALLKLRPRQRIAVAGLNPHAGENNAFGSEDSHEIAPAILTARADGLDAHGPFPPDTIFKQTLEGKFDAVVCMYHDQGHIPLKLLDFEGGTNVTLGLPIVRTSVDHGTAFDIAYQGKAFTQSLEAACTLALHLTA